MARVVSVLSSEQSQQTIGAIKSGEKALTISSGQMVAVIAVPALGTMAVQGQSGSSTSDTHCWRGCRTWRPRSRASG